MACAKRTRRDALGTCTSGRAHGRAAPALVLLAAGAVLTAGCRQEEAPAEEPLRPVRTTVVQRAPDRVTRVFGGVSRAGREAELSFRVGGRVAALPVKAGDRLREGALVARLDPGDFELEAERARAALAQARADIRNAEAQYERARELWEAEVASLADLDAARAAFESARAQVQAARQQVALAEQQVAYTVLRAPAPGRVAAVRAEVNETVEAGRPIVLFHSGRLPEVRVTVPESFVGSIRMGQDAAVGFDTLPDRAFPATVTEIGAVGERETTFPVTVRLRTAPAAVRPGLAAQVTFALPRQEEVVGVVVPPNAVGEDRQGRFAMVVQQVGEGVGRVSRREVEVGALHSSGLEVVSGLEPGDRLVTAGLSDLEDGDRVLLVPEEDEAPAGAAAP